MRGFTCFALLGALLCLTPRPALAQDFGEMLDDVPLIDPFGVVDQAVEAVEEAADDAKRDRELDRARRAAKQRAAESRETATRANAKPSPSPEELIREADAALQAAETARRELDPNRPPVPRPDEKTLRIIPEEMQLASVYISGGRDRSRYLGLRLWLVNPTEAAISIQREDLRLVLLGKEIAPGPPPEHRGHRVLQIGETERPLSEVEHEGTVAIAPNSATEILIAFFDLPGAGDVPQMTLKLPVGEKTIEADLNAFALGRMRPTIERIGAGRLLGIVTIGGEINDISVGGLVELLEQLVQAKTTRVVLRWTDDAPSVSPEIMSWLGQQQARPQFFGRGGNNDQHPNLPGGLADLRLTNLPEDTSDHAYVPGGSWVRLHDTLAEAVAASLAEPYRAIPLEALRQEIASGHKLTRPVAIAAGNRLPESDLPQLLALSQDEDPAIAQAAVSALGGFVAPEAIARLVEAAKSGPEPLRIAAVESLAASRHGQAHEALRDLLGSTLHADSTIPLESLSQVLARYPRDLWRDTLFELALRAEPRDRRDVLLALARVGHPRLDEALAAALTSGNRKLEVRALNLLIQQTDPRSEELALEYTLEYIQDHEPTGEMTLLLGRVKDPRAVPLLLDQIDGISNESMSLVQLLGKIGGQKARERIEDLYASAAPAYRGQLLVVLNQMNSPKALEFAVDALEDHNQSVLQPALQIIKEDGSPAVVETLGGLLKRSTDASRVRAIAGLLGEIGTDAALVSLKQAIRQGEPWEDLVSPWYAQARQTSPGFDAFQEGGQANENQDWKKAKQHYSTAIELDPGFIEAWSGRAHMNMQLEEREAARADYEHVLELDSGDTGAITCLAILKVVEGQVEEGLSDIEQRADEFRDDELFAYNAACAKALAAEQMARTYPKRAERLRTEAVQDLERSFDLGMDDEKEISWAREDPDLKSLHSREDYERVMKAAEEGIKPPSTDRAPPKLGNPAVPGAGIF